MDVNALEDFQLVAAHGGFGKASRASGRSKATLSRRISDLEESLGVRLIERGRQRLELTDPGRRLLASTEGPMREVAEALAATREGLAKPRGLLRITAPLLFSHLALGRLGARFLAAHPEVELQIVSEDRAADLVEEHFDVAIRINPREEATLVGRRFAKDRMIIAAAPSLPLPSGRNRKPVPVPAVVMPSFEDGDTWTLSKRPMRIAPRPVLRLSSLLTVRDAVLAGAGVALLPQSIIGRQLASGELVAWGTTGHDTELWVLHTSRRLASPKVRAFVDFLCSQYPSGWLETL